VARNSDYRAGALVAQEHGAAVRPAAADRADRAGRGRDSRRALRLLGLIAVALGLAALTAAACALSYSSIHRLATEAGVSPRLASIYPLIFDALLVIAGCSVLALRGAGLGSRIYGWFCLLVLLGGLAAGGAVHAAAIRIPRRLAGVVAAVVPWAIVLIGFGLLLALLRYARLRRIGQQPDEAAARVADPRAGAGADLSEDLVVMANTAEPPTTPQPTVPRDPEHQEAPDSRDAGGQPVPDLVKGARPRPPVGQADMQLRARIPRQPAEQAPAGQVTPRHAPFMPPVGPLPAAGTPEGGHQTNPLPADPLPADPLPADRPAADRPAEPSTPSTLNPAPTADDVDDEPGDPPALRRPHSSPTPPQD
jgi:hypothetical protein